MTPAAFDPSRFTLHPGARWGRMLTLMRDRCVTTAEILNAVHAPGRGPRAKERKRILNQLKRMSAWGLAECAGPWGWTATDAGRAAVDAMTARLSTETVQ